MNKIQEVFAERGTLGALEYLFERLEERTSPEPLPTPEPQPLLPVEKKEEEDHA